MKISERLEKKMLNERSFMEVLGIKTEGDKYKLSLSKRELQLLRNILRQYITLLSKGDVNDENRNFANELSSRVRKFV